MSRLESLSRHDLDSAEAVIKFSFLMQALIAEAASEQAFTNTQARTLAILRDRSLTMGELGGILALEKSSVTILVDRAVDAGLLKRMPSERDRRTVEVTLTTKGRAIDAKLRATVTTRISKIMKDKMDARQRTEFTRIIRSIVDPVLPEPA